jgi:type II secretory pathway component PulF
MTPANTLLAPVLPRAAAYDGSQGAWTAMVGAVHDVYAFVSSEPILMWLFLATIVIGVGAAIAKALGETFRIVIGLVAGIAGIVLIVYVLRSLGIL